MGVTCDFDEPEPGATSCGCPRDCCHLLHNRRWRSSSCDNGDLLLRSAHLGRTRGSDSLAQPQDSFSLRTFRSVDSPRAGSRWAAPHPAEPAAVPDPARPVGLDPRPPAFRPACIRNVVGSSRVDGLSKNRRPDLLYRGNVPLLRLPGSAQRSHRNRSGLCRLPVRSLAGIGGALPSEWSGSPQACLALGVRPALFHRDTGPDKLSVPRPGDSGPHAVGLSPQGVRCESFAQADPFQPGEPPDSSCSDPVHRPLPAGPSILLLHLGNCPSGTANR